MFASISDHIQPANPDPPPYALGCVYRANSDGCCKAARLVIDGLRGTGYFGRLPISEVENDLLFLSPLCSTIVWLSGKQIAGDPPRHGRPSRGVRICQIERGQALAASCNSAFFCFVMMPEHPVQLFNGPW